MLATVKGDVHDIGKNLVDIILSNNGYDVVNLGIKQPISEIIRAADEHDADAIGMSGLLVKSTVVMKENLEELNSRGVVGALAGAARWCGADPGLRRERPGRGLRGRGPLRQRRVRGPAADGRRRQGPVQPRAQRRRGAARAAQAAGPGQGDRDRRRRARPTRRRSDVATDNSIPTPPFWGTRVVKGIALADYASYLDERATFLGQWGLKGARGDGPSYDELVETEGRPRLRMWLDRIQTEDLLEAAVVYGYFPCYSEGNDVVVLHDDGPQKGQERARFTFPRQRRDRRLCLADFFRSKARYEQDGRPDVIAFHLVTMGAKVAEATAELFAANAYRDYLELHGLSVQLTEALAELWHARVREELGFGADDDESLDAILRQGYRGSRYSFGYPACPDLEDRAVLVELLDPSRIGVTLSEELQLHPEQSTDAMVVHHPEAKYFNAT